MQTKYRNYGDNLWGNLEHPQHKMLRVLSTNPDDCGYDLEDNLNHYPGLRNKNPSHNPKEVRKEFRMQKEHNPQYHY